MAYDIIVGRSKSDIAKFGKRGCVLIGKSYIQMGTTQSLSSKVYFDVAGAHVIFIPGKRGGGKSYTMGVIAEGFSLLEPEIKQNLSIILLDTMGIYWTMRYGNKHEVDLLGPWNLKPQPVDIKIFTPEKYYHKYKEQGIPTDIPFTLDASLLSGDDWVLAFKQDKYSPIGILITRLILEMKKVRDTYTVDDLIEAVKNDRRAEQNVKDAAENMFLLAKGWGVFGKGTPLSELAKGGQITVLDLSAYATMPGGWDVKALVLGIIAQHLFINRMEARKKEEFAQVHSALHYFGEEKQAKQEMPLVWLVIDEAHEFLPVTGKVASTDALVTIMREGRQPGISLILATQQPGKIHTDVMTQSDIVLSHRITAEMDTKALGLLAQSYMREGLIGAMNTLPRVKGAAVLFDDTNERLYPIRVRPRFTWHGGGSPTAIPEEKKGI